MEQQDLSKISIKDSGYYISYANWTRLLKKNNITTVKELLDSDITELEKNVSLETRGQLRLLVAMLKTKYLGEPLCYGVLLDKKIDLERLEHLSPYSCALPVVIDSGEKEARELLDSKFDGITLMELIGIDRYSSNGILKKYFETINSKSDNNELSEIPKVIDFIKWISPQFRPKLAINEYMNTYIKEYEKEHKIDNTKPETLEFYRGQLASLLDMKEKLDVQISDLKSKIEYISNNETKGGIKR